MNISKIGWINLYTITKALDESVAYGVVIQNKSIRNYINGCAMNITLPRAELLSIIKGIEQLVSGDYDVVIYTKCQYIIDAINKNTIMNWSRNGGFKSDGSPVKNMDLWEILFNHIRRFSRVYCKKVRISSNYQELNKFDRWYYKNCVGEYSHTERQAFFIFKYMQEAIKLADAAMFKFVMPFKILK